jgi:hypothetical protein
MSTYDKASLVLIPSGTKEGVVFSQKPTNGDGDFTFTRASSATRVNSDGLIEKETQNLLQQSNTFDSGSWTAQNISVTSGQSGYDGSNDAYKLTPNTSNAAHRILQTFTAAGNSVQTWSVYAKADGYNFIRITENAVTGDRATFNISTGSVFSSLNDIDTDIQDVGNGWYRCSLTINTGASHRFDIYVMESGSVQEPWAGNGTSGVLIQDAQVNYGLVADSYLETTTTAVYGGITDNIPRLDYTDASCPSLLLEPQRTNLIHYGTPSAFTGTATTNYWYSATLGTTDEVNATIGIDGYQSATQYTNISSGPTDYMYYKDLPVTSGSTYTLSGYVKLGTATNACVVVNNTSSWDSVTNGAISLTGAAGYDEWKRFEITFTAPSSNKVNIHIGYHQETGITAQSTGTFFVDSFQLEAGSYPTSYIPTYGASVTFASDACSKTGISDLIGQTEGTLFLEINISHLDGTAARDFFFLSNANDLSNDWVGIGFSGVGSNALRARVSDGGVRKFDQYGTISSTATYKMALAYKSGDSEFYVNGVSFGTNYANTSFSLTLDRIFDAPNFTFGDSIKQILLFKTRLSNEELADLTTI